MRLKIFRDGRPISFILDGRDQSPVFLGFGQEGIDNGFSDLEIARNVAIMHAGWHAGRVEGIDLTTWSGSERRKATHAEDKSARPAGPGVWTMTAGGASYEIRDVSGDEAAA